MPEIDRELAALAAGLRRSTVQVVSRGGRGSGLIAATDGTIVTNAHVLEHRDPRVILADGRSLRGELVARAPERDLALLRVRASDLEPVTFRDPSTLRPGHVVVAMGNPLDLVGALSTGIVHSIDPRGRRVVADLTLLPGNSGGPLADANGAVIGVSAMVVNGLAVAIASPVVRRFIEAPFARPRIGVTTQAVRVTVLGEPRLGLVVVGFSEGSPALRAGVLVGDVLIGTDGRLFESPDDLAIAVEDMPLGAPLRLDIVRGGRVSGIEVRVSDPAAKPSAA